MAKATLLFVGTADGVVLWSDPGGTGRWLRAGHSLPGQAIRAVWAKPDDPQIALALAGPGVQRSSDGGRAWHSVLEVPDAVAFAGDRSMPDDVALLRADGTQLISHDAGATWAAGSSVAPFASSDAATLPGREPVLLRVAPHAIERSSDTGATWQATETDVPWAGDLAVVVAAGYHMDTAFAGSAGGHVAISSDRGRTWRIIARDLPEVTSIAAARLV